MENYSILMTVYKKDNPSYVKEAINSILKQTFLTNDFVIVCDGPLTKELYDLLDEYKQNDIFNIIYLEKNIGLGAALKKGVTFCKNELIARMDDDDISLENRCEMEVKFLENNKDISIVGSHVYEFEGDIANIIREKKVPIEYKDICSFSKKRNPFNHSTVMFRKQDIIKVGNYSEMRTNQDVDLWVRLLNQGYKGKNIDESLVYFRFDESTYSRRKDWKNIKLHIKVWNNFYKKNYCSFIDFLTVMCFQLAVFIMPTGLIRWCYDNLR